MSKSWKDKFSDENIKRNIKGFLDGITSRMDNIIDKNIITFDQLHDLIQNLKNSKDNAITSSVIGYSDFVDMFVESLYRESFDRGGRLWMSYTEFLKQGNLIISDSNGIKQPEYKFRAYRDGLDELDRLVNTSIPNKKLVADIRKDFEKASFSDDINEKNLCCKNLLEVLGSLTEENQTKILVQIEKSLESIFLSFKPHITKAFEQTTGLKVDLKERRI